MTFGKAISGGTSIDADEVARMQVDDLMAAKARWIVTPLEKTDDILSQRVSEELDYTKRLLETVETRLAGCGASGAAIAQVEEAEEMLGDLSKIVDAKDRCAAVDRVKTPSLKRRLLRRDVDGESSVCRSVASTSEAEI